MSEWKFGKDGFMSIKGVRKKRKKKEVEQKIITKSSSTQSAAAPDSDIWDAQRNTHVKKREEKKKQRVINTNPPEPVRSEKPTTGAFGEPLNPIEEYNKKVGYDPLPLSEILDKSELSLIDFSKSVKIDELTASEFTCIHQIMHSLKNNILGVQGKEINSIDKSLALRVLQYATERVKEL